MSEAPKENLPPVSTKLVGDLTIFAGHDFQWKRYFLRLRDDKKLLFEWTSLKPILNVSTVKKELIDHITNIKAISTKKEAKEVVSSSFSNIYNDFKELVNNVTSVASATSVTTYRDRLCNVIYSTKCLLTNTSASCGTIEDKYYFGILMPVNIQENKDGKETTTQKNNLVLSFSDHSHIIVDQEYCNAKKIIMSGDPVQQKPRWELERIETWHGDYKNDFDHEEKDIFQEISNLYKEFIYFDDDGFYDVLPLWDIGTYFFTLFNNYPYVDFWGLKRTGKTKAMTLSSLMSFNSFMFINMSPASLFRIVDQNKCTLYIDEAENLWTQDKGDDDTSDIVALLNAGWMKGSFVPRVEKDSNGNRVIEQFDPYCPKMLGSIKGLKGALHDRCIKVVSVRATKEDGRGDNWPENTDPRFQAIRNKLYVFALKNWKGIYAFSKQSGNLGIKKEFDLSNRDWQIWKPLLCIAKVIDKDLYNRVGKFAERQTQEAQLAEYREDSWDIKLYQTMMDIECSIERKVYVREIRNLLDKHFSDLDKKPSSDWIGKHLNKIGFKRFRRRDSSGTYYLLQKKKIKSTLATLISPTLDAQATQVTSSGNADVEVETVGEEGINSFEKEAVDFVKHQPECTLDAFVNRFDEQKLKKLLTNGVLFEPKPGILKEL